MSKSKRVQYDTYDDGVPHVAQQSRGNICRLDAQERSHTIRVDLSEPRRRGVLEPIIRGYAIGFDVESERVVQVGQLQLGVAVCCGRSEVVGRRDVAKQF